jgi:hypothetical protein
MANKGQHRGGAIEGGRTLRCDWDMGWPRCTRGSQQARKRGEWLAGGSRGIEKSGAIEVITLLQVILYTASSLLLIEVNDIHGRAETSSRPYVEEAKFRRREERNHGTVARQREFAMKPGSLRIFASSILRRSRGLVSVRQDEECVFS